MRDSNPAQHDFVAGQEYTREEIHDVLGGELETYLPQKNKRIVCGAFTPKLNPGVPDVLLVGNAPKVIEKAETLCEQTGAIPVFIKKGQARWEYRGDYAVRDWTEDPALIKRHEKGAGRRGVVRVVYLTKVR
jgi:hypothetical protein